MMLPQLLEPIMAGAEGEGGAEEGDDTDWLDKARPCGCCFGQLVRQWLGTLV